MGRLTRAKAAAVAEQLHIDEDALLEMHEHKDILSPTSLPEDRNPLCELSPNSASSKYDEEEEVRIDRPMEVPRTGKKGARKGTRTNTLGASTASAAQDEASEVGPDEHGVAQSPTCLHAAEDVAKETSEGEDISELEASRSPAQDIRPTTPSPNAARLTRSRLRGGPSGVQSAEQAVETERSNVSPDHPVDQETSQDGRVQEPVQTVADNVQSQVSVEYPVSETMPNVLQPINQTPTTTSESSQSEHTASSAASTTDMENVYPNGDYDQLEQAVVHASTPPRSTPKSPNVSAPKPTHDQLETAVLSAPKLSRKSVSAVMSDDPIAALDAQDDAVEKISAEVPDVQDSPQKPRSKKGVPAVRTTKASQARISLAHGLPDAPPKAPAMGRPRQSMSSSTSKRITSISSVKSNGVAADDEPAEKKEIVIPHSKPRPMSMQFKAPPPPAKSTKAPTQSNFQLPGEAIAAKLKAAREARQQKEAEDRKKKVFKARPAPSMTKAPAVRQTSTSKARESLISGKPLAASSGAARPKSVATSRPAPMAKPRTSTVRPTRPSIAPRTIAPRVAMAPAKSNDLTVTKRPSTIMAKSASRPRPSTVLGVSTSRPRASLAPKPNPPAAAASRPTFQAGKGKEVFKRAAEAKSSAEQQKREKEDAAKKARATASERSRQLSREWAEKQRVKKCGTKPEEANKPAADLLPEANEETTTNAELSNNVVVATEEVPGATASC